LSRVHDAARRSALRVAEPLDPTCDARLMCASGHGPGHRRVAVEPSSTVATSPPTEPVGDCADGRQEHAAFVTGDDYDADRGALAPSEPERVPIGSAEDLVDGLTPARQSSGSGPPRIAGA
jgi:hypothetical protein